MVMWFFVTYVFTNNALQKLHVTLFMIRNALRQLTFPDFL